MKIPLGTASAEIEVKRSRFVSCAGPLEHPEEVRKAVERTRKAHPGCSHVVWAFLSGAEAERFGMSDDHEPKGTAGRPTLEVLRGSGVTDVLIRTVRYFGGTKLGTGGLVRAYTRAAQEVLARLATEPLVHRETFHLSLDYSAYDRFLNIAEELDALIDDTEFGVRVSIGGRIDAHRADALAARVRDLTNGETTVIYEER